MAVRKVKEIDPVDLLKEASKVLNKISEEDLYGYSNIGFKIEKRAKRTQNKINKYLAQLERS